MTNLFSQACRELWGPEFQGPASRALKVRRDTIQDFAQDRPSNPVPRGIWAEIAGMLARQQEVSARIGSAIVEKFGPFMEEES